MKDLTTYNEFLTEGLKRSPLQNQIKDKFGNAIQKLTLIEDDEGGLEFNIVIINNSHRGKGIIKEILQIVIDYADDNNKIVHLTPTDEYGSDKKKLTDLYKSYGFVKNKDKRFDNTMMRPVK